MMQEFLLTDDDVQDLVFPDDDAWPDSGQGGSDLDVACERTGAHSARPFAALGGAFNHCTLDGKPARIIGRSFPYASIEPLDMDAEPIRCCWDVVAHVMDECDGAFIRADDDIGG